MEIVRKLSTLDKGHFLDTIGLMKDKYDEETRWCYQKPILYMNELTYEYYLKETNYNKFITKKFKMPNDFGYGTIYGIPIMIDDSIMPDVLILREEEEQMAPNITGLRLNYTYNLNVLPIRYIVNKNAVILFWADGTKTVVKRSKDDEEDAVKGFLWAYFEKNSGMSKTKTNKYLRKVEEALIEKI